MARNLPPLNSLLAFEAAARHLSFKKAADEQNVTPAAIGHQIKNLESHLSVQLFRRFNRGIELTTEGAAMVSELSAGFDLLSRAAEKVRARNARTILTITVAPSFGAKWLLPRLTRFYAEHRDISVRIDTDPRELDMEANGLDIAIRFSSGQYLRHRVDRLMGETLIPVCSPKLLSQPQALKSPRHLSKHTLLHIEGETVDAHWADWSGWLKAVGCKDVDGEAGPRFSQSLMAVQAAIQAQGIALAPWSIVAEDIEQGRLVRLFENIEGIPTGFAYFLVSPASIAGIREVEIFRNWLMNEAGRDAN